MSKQKIEYFTSPLKIAQYLNELGYKIGKSKAYTDCGPHGKLRPDKKGRYSVDDIKLYAAKYLKKITGEGPDLADTLDKLHMKKLQLAVDIQARQKKKLDIEIAKQEGELVSKADVRREVLGRIFTFIALYRNGLPLLVPDLVAEIRRVPDQHEAEVLLRRRLEDNFTELISGLAKPPLVRVHAGNIQKTNERTA